MTNPIFYKRISGSSIQGDGYSVTEPSGTLVIANGGELRLHDGSTAGGNPVGGEGGLESFGTDRGIGGHYASNNPAILFSDDNMIIRTGGTAGHGTTGAMYIASAEELIIGHSDSSLTDVTSLGASNFTDYLQIDTNGIEMTTARGTVQFGYNLEAPGAPTHFHINKLNQSFDLFFGDDSNYFHLPAGGGSPVIGANDGSSGQKLWTFGQDGSLTLPQSNSGAAVISAGTVGLEFTSNGHALQLGTDGTLILPATNNITAANTPQVGTIVNDIEAWASAGAPYTYGWIGATNFSTLYALGDLTGWVFYPTGFPGQAVTVTAMNPFGLDSLGFSGNLPDGTTYTAHSPDYAPGGPNPVVISVNEHSWSFGIDSNLTFPDLTVQTTAFELQGLPPSSAWGTTYPAGPGVTNMDYQFFFDGGIGYPTMQSYASAGGNPLYNSIWSVESVINGAPTYTSSGATPVQVNNTGGVGIFAGALNPGDYVIVRIQNLDTGRIYRATFMGSYNAADTGNEVKYGSITVERLL